jgi:cyanophycinase
MTTRKSGRLIVIGGHEDREGEMVILREVARDAMPDGAIVVATIASEVPEELWATYQRAFHRIGVKRVAQLDIRSRAEAESEEKLRILDGARVVFFSGGDQLKITGRIGGTPVYDRICAIYEEEGGTIAGTSAGASVMCETMLVRGEEEQSARLGARLIMAPGLGFVRHAIIDQHFAQRGRIGRLLGAVAHNPRVLGLGIDENTAAIFNEGRFAVLGENAVYAVDGNSVDYSNVTELGEDRALSLFDVRLHVLSQGDSFDLRERRPHAAPDSESEDARAREQQHEPIGHQPNPRGFSRPGKAGQRTPARLSRQRRDKSKAAGNGRSHR